MELIENSTAYTPLCGICGGDHIPSECSVIPVKCSIPDKTYPSRAKLTLPDDLKLTALSDSSHRITTTTQLAKGTLFGPLQAKRMCTLLPSIIFPLKIFPIDEEDLTEYYLDTSNEYECNWMMFIQPASNLNEQNMIIYQQNEELFYVTSRDISEGEELRAWYAPHYAVKMKQDLLVSPVCNDRPDPEPNDILVKKNKNITPREIWNCKFCGKIENSVTKFAKHLIVHYQAISNKTCEICTDTFRNKRLYHKHLKIVHAKAQRKSVLDSNLEITKGIAKPIKPKELSFGGPLLLNDVNSDSLDNTAVNLILPQEFQLYQETLLESENLIVDNLLNENDKELSHFNFDLIEPESDKLMCDICLKDFKKPKYLVSHLNQHTGKFTCHDCKKVFARNENFKFHMCKSYYNLKCSLCDKLFFQNKTLNHHMKVIHEKKFTCDHCSKIFNSHGAMKQHQPCGKEIQKKILHCEICSKPFMWRRNLRAHMKRHQSDMETFTCPQCGRQLKDRRIYMKHLEIHAGTQFECDTCHKLFNRKDNLIMHIKNVHDAQEVTCDICNKQLKTRKLLLEHKKTHIDRTIKCSLCELVFKSPIALKRHVIKVHQSTKEDSKKLIYEYSCPKCQKAIKFRWSLRRHIRNCHPDFTYDEKSINRKIVVNDEDVLDLKQTIENMDFNTDDVNNTENNDINSELDNLLNNQNIFLNDSNETMMENLIDSVVNDANLNPELMHKEVRLSMPDLSEGAEIKLAENAYIMENGTIIEPKKNESEVVLYILNNKVS